MGTGRINCLLRLAAAALIAVTLAAALAGCGGGNGNTAGTSQGTSAPTTPGTTPGTQPSGKTVKIFFLKGEVPTAVEREAAETGARAALVRMLEGPSATEASAGLATAIPAGTRLIGYSVEGGSAAADFSSELAGFGGGSAMLQAITDQIENTVKANDGSVKYVKVLIDGVPAEEALQP